jgi:uncharacterized membrane protein YbaN (DUF454 family)
MKRVLFLTFGIISLILGAIGIVVPVLPTVPFLLLSAYLFASSSPKMLHFLLKNKILGQYLSDYYHHKPIPLRQRIISIFFIWLGLGLTFYFANLHLWLIALLASIGLAVSIYIASLGKRRLKRRELAIRIACDHSSKENPQNHPFEKQTTCM